MSFKSIKHKLILMLLILSLISSGLLPVNNVEASRRHVRYVRRIKNRRRYYYRNYRKRRVKYRTYYHFPRRYYRPYPTVNDRIRRVNFRINRSHRPNYRKETIKSIYGPRVTFKTMLFIPVHVGGRDFFVQSLNITPDGHYAFVGYGHNPMLKHGRNLTKVAKINLQNHHYQVSKAFNGGHGQALAYNVVNHSLWLLDDSGGPINKGSFERINPGSLKPQHKIRFYLKSSDELGDSLTFDNHNHVYNEDLIWKDTAKGGFRNGMIILYRGLLNSHHVKFNIVLQGLRHSPGSVVQGIAYNPKTKRLYIEVNDAIVSIPVNKLGRLQPRDVKETILRQRREYEGLSFDRKGYAYILLNGPKEIMKSTGVF